ncbi:MAG: hypothetical protein ACOYO1_17425 [Bacteroidales bacterium]
MFLKRFFFLLAIVVIISNQSSFSQNTRSFSKDKNFFIEEIKSFFGDDKNADKDQKASFEVMLKDFEPLWNSTAIDDNQKKEILTATNLMLKLKMKAFPNFYSFFIAIIDFKKSNQTQKSYNAWFKGVNSLLDFKRQRYFLPYLENTSNLLKFNYLYTSKAIRWYSTNNEFYFENDTAIRIIFPSLDLICQANKDSSVISNTKGVFFPLENKWFGEGGKVSWLRAGFDTEKVYAQLKNYEIDFRFAKYSADSVQFYYTTYFSYPLLGFLQEKIMADISDEEKASYPRFNSYDNRLIIKDIFKNIDYEGGFSLNGAKLIGFGDKYQDAYLKFNREAKEFVVIASKSFAIRKDKVSSNLASVTIYWKGDSIYHPGLEMKYMDYTKELTLIRGMNDLSESPFFNTYHKLDMYFEAMYWKIDETKIDFSMIRSPGRTSRATFESFNYYSEARYTKLQGIDEINPLYRIKKYIDTYGTQQIYVSDLSYQMKIEPEQVKAMLIKLSNMGFLIYDSDDEVVYVKDKVNEYIKALNRKTDYDALQFHSIVDNDVNASLSLLNFDLKIKGVPVILLSDSQNVFIYPSNQEVLLKKNRDFLFTGRIHAGRFDYFAKGCSFIYDDFKLNLPVIDSMSVRVLSFTENEKGERPLVKLNTVIQDLKGELLVDNPRNKSGLKSYPEYPQFSSKEESYVYYDKPSILNGVYLKDKFFYKVKSFKIENLDRIPTDSLSFNGSLTSAGIFPLIVEPLKVQPDYSLGFIKKTPNEGLSNYGGKGKYYDKIDLSNQGLRGHGKLEYLTSTSKSDNFIFFPDSMNSIAQQFDIKEQTTLMEYPQLTSSNVKEHWRPYNDSLIVTQQDSAFKMYNHESQLSGNVVLTPQGLTGKGSMVFEKAEMESNMYQFKQHLFDADTANFRLRSYDLTDLAFNTENYKSHIDFKKRNGEFKSNGGVSKVNFPINRYQCYMDLLDWSMDKDEIALRNTTKPGYEGVDKLSLKELLSADLPGSDFVSTHPSQDSLRFKSPRAVFNMKDYIITAEDVKLIRVADAAIAPDKGKVVILRQAEIQPLANASILADTATKYHSFYQALASIHGKRSFIGNGNYDYIDENENKHQIYFNNISVVDGQTIANGSISDSSGFALSPAFEFTGNVQLNAPDEFLNFSGGSRIRHLCGQEALTWLKFNAKINPKEVMIPISADPQDIFGKKLTAGILVSNTGQIYTSFAGPKRYYSDTIISASGFLKFYKDKKEYRIASVNKLNNPDTVGNMLVMDINSCVTAGEGNINLGAKLGRLEMSSFGNVTNNMRSNEATFDLVIPVNFFFHPDALKMMGQSLYTNNSLTGIENSSNVKVKKAFTEILGEKDAEKVVNEINMYGSLRKVPDKLDYTLLLTDVKLRYDSITKSFISMGEIGVGNVGKTQINKYVKGYLQMIKKRSGDIFTLYLELDESEWYFFNYSNNLMQAFSSIKDFNELLIKEKPDKRRLEAENGLPSYSYGPSTERKRNDFIKRMEAAGATGEEPSVPEQEKTTE